MPIPPAVTFPSPNEWPNAIRDITGISQANHAVVTSVDHGFTQADDAGVTCIVFSRVQGMTQINGKLAPIVQVIDTDNFSVNLRTSEFEAYTSAGQLKIVCGIYPYDPFTNIA